MRRGFSTSRRSRLAALVAVIAITAAVGAPAGAAVTRDDALSWQLVAEVNGLRSSEGLPILKESPALARAAATHASSMAELGYFSHSSSDGTSPADRIASYLPPRSARHRTLGEIILWTTGTISASDAVARWLASPPHRADLLRPGWRELGVAAVHAANAPGVYGGRDVTIIVIDFARRR